VTERTTPIDSLRRRYDELRPELRQRLPALALALALEALLVLILLSLGSVKEQAGQVRDTLVAFTSAPDEADQPEESPAPSAAAPAPSPQQPTAEQPPQDETTPQPPVSQPVPAPRPILRNDFSLQETPRQAPPASPAQGPPAPAYGPPDTPAPGDTPRIAGSGPNGEPLYAARWYRRPYDDELAGYLSTAQGPGWGLIDCRTAPDFRVEDCVIVGESPQGSGIGRAVQAAAWQFKVRPPQKGGRPMVGEWVRIRIDYGIRGAAAR
jgi:periplasmic protein TonB